MTALTHIDSLDMRTHIRAMGDHLRDARARALAALESIHLPQKDWANIIVCGIGGSAIAGDLVRAYLTDLAIPLVVVRGYDLPAVVSDRSLIVLSSYSGNTEESLSLFNQALQRQLTIVAITTGGTLGRTCEALGIPVLPQEPGMQPRAALAYGFAPLLTLLEHVGLAPDQGTSLAEAARELSNTVTLEDTEASSTYALATALQSRIAIIYTADDILGPVGTRWRGQIQENAKHMAYSSVLPEMNHNEINAWQHPADLIDRMRVIFLRSPQDEHERVQLRFRILHEYLEGRGVAIAEVMATGNSRLARMFSLIAKGDWVSYWLALQTHTDPTPIPAIDYLKSRLS